MWVLTIFPSIYKRNLKVFITGFLDHWPGKPVSILLTVSARYILTEAIALFWLQPRNCMKRYLSLRLESANWRTPSGRLIITYPLNPILFYRRNSSGSKRHCNEMSTVANPRLLLLLKKKNLTLMLLMRSGPYR
jgi:hypothetical protein